MGKENIEGSSIMILPIKKKWFDMIKAGIKKEEYRDVKPYYDSRFKGKLYIDIIFRNGYSKSSPQIKCTCRICLGNGREEWGAVPGKIYYVLEILDVKNIRRNN